MSQRMNSFRGEVAALVFTGIGIPVKGAVTKEVERRRTEGEEKGE